MKQEKRQSKRLLRELGHYLLVLAGATGMTLALFLVLPLMQTLSKPPDADLLVRLGDTARLEAPDPPPEPEPEKEPEPEEPPKLEDAPAAPLDLSQLEVALNPGVGDGWAQGDFQINLTNVLAKKSEDVEGLFDASELDQPPRALYQASPVMSGEMRRKTPGTVYIIFVVDSDGRVVEPKVQKSSDPIFEKPALDAIKKWKFDPGKRGGNAVRFKMRVPFIFPKGG